ncbi:conjugal transfer protein TraH [Budviciaceae bacterium BWR-B9]|uniref:Conjugal transfer protein TraH n=1 Tax=Limnobaculum allomyrinae TaxID=2791986 RepID=A0ABS1IUV4_9GAMM|nr:MULTISPECIES: conjugal transfer pilus assembly protein TraH [Limnobaculum]MBK5145536.1 conjugal transfer protein TraH [Limnobaculum allomyrinae]MBV7693655.1 conjugal transfer protein TraH [Limnobaculum sp. M2-1]
MKLKSSVLAITITLNCLFPAFADVNSDMNSFFNKLGFDSNTTQPQVWQGQAAGYASGGSIYARTSVKQIQLMSIQMPSLNAGCGGIDAYLGAFSFINGEQLQRLVKQIMSNAAGYAFDLALQATVPDMKKAKDFLQNLANDINSLSASTCQAAQAIVGGIVPQFEEGQKKICQDIAGQTNAFADWAASRQGCTIGGSYRSVTNNAPPDKKDEVLRNKNLIWDSLGANTMFSGDSGLREFAMSLSGTIIYDDNGKVTSLPPLAGNHDIITAMVNGGKANVYQCDNSTCLNPKIASMTISRENSLNGQVKAILASIQSKAISDEPLTQKERGFIESTSVPVLKYLVDPQMLGISSPVIVQLSEYITYDILMQYIQELIQQSRTMLGGKKYPEPVMKLLRESLIQASLNIGILQSDVQVKQDALLVLDRQMSYLRQQVSSRLLTRYQDNYRFERP